MTASTALPGAQKSISKKKRSGSGSGSQGEGKVATPRHCAKVGTAPTNIPQVSWAAVWQMYGQRCNENAEANVDNSGPGTIYELLASVTKSRDDFDPLGAMVLAKSANEDKSDDEKIIGGRWEWSPQSIKAYERLQTAYGDDLSKAWAAGWRWYPKPTPKTKSHEHRWYPPRDKLAVVRAWCDLDSNESIRSAKSGKSVETRLTKGIEFLSSNMLRGFLNHGGSASLFGGGGAAATAAATGTAASASG